MLFDARRALPQINQDILDVAEYIRENGWCQRSYWKLDGSVCVLGALRRVTLGSPRRYEIAEWLAAKLGESVAGWNDAPDRTKEQILAKLEEIGWDDNSEQAKNN